MTDTKKNTLTILAVVLTIAVIFSACTSIFTAKAVYDLRAEAKAQTETQEDGVVILDQYEYVSDLPYDKVENFLLSYSTTGKADEIAVIAVKDSADVTKAADSLRAHVESRRKLFLQYGPAEAARVEKAQVFTKDQYAVLIICDDSPTVKTAFDDFLPSSDTGSD